MILQSRQTRIEVECLIDLEQTADSLHAYALLENVVIGPGDTVLIHGAPSGIAYGEQLQLACTASVLRAGPITRIWTQVTALLELFELFEVGFQPKETA